MFSLISENWAGEPLVNYETMLKYIRKNSVGQGIPLPSPTGSDGLQEGSQGIP